MNDSEWREIYIYLLNKLREVADSSVIADIERAAAARIEEDINEDNEYFRGVSRESREDLDPIRLRAPTPHESFAAAISVLVCRLREVPASTDRLIEKIERPPSNIKWKSDVPERDVAIDQSVIYASDLKLRGEEKEEVESILQRIETLLREQE